jgi:hypothetical protein
MKPIPDGTYEDLASAAAGLGEQGRVHELLLHHLAMAGVAPRVDWRVLHVEHASTLALQLGDGGLRALVALFEALLATFLGEDEDAIEYAGQAKELAAGTREPRATAITHCAELLASGRTITPAIDMLWSAGVRIEPFAWGLTSSEPSPDAREGG